MVKTPRLRTTARPIQPLVDLGVTGEHVLKAPPVHGDGLRSVPRLVMMTTGVIGAPGVPAITSVAGITPGLARVSKETAPQVPLTVKERIHRLDLVLKITKVSWSPPTTRLRSTSPPSIRHSPCPPSLYRPESGTLKPVTSSAAESSPGPLTTVWSSQRMERVGSPIPNTSNLPEWPTLLGRLLAVT